MKNEVEDEVEEKKDDEDEEDKVAEALVEDDQVVETSSPTKAFMCLAIKSVLDNFIFILWLAISLVAAIYLFFKKKYRYWNNRDVNYVEPTIPLGNIPFRQTHFKDIFDVIYKHKDGSPFVGAYLFTSPIVVPTELDFIQHILVKDFNSFHERGMYANEADDPLSAHMFALDGERWKSIRTKLSPTFTSGRMKFMFPTVVEVAERLHRVLSHFVETDQEFEFKDLLARYTTDVIGTCAFGIECNSLDDPNSAFRYHSRKTIEKPNLNPVLQFVVTQYPNLGRKLHLKTVSSMESDFFMETVRDTINYRKKNNVRRNDFMDSLIQLNNVDDAHPQNQGKLSFNECAAQAFLFFVAGFETSATNLTFSLYELALNPVLQERARNEIHEVLAKHGGKLTYDAVSDMLYIDQIINESLRKHPPALFLIRKSSRNYKIPNTNISIDKGTEIYIPIYSIHRDPDVYPNPEKFDPDRFSPEQKNARHPMSFLAFGDGPRNCVGLRFGKLQSKIGLITMLKGFRFTASPETLIPMVYASDTLGLTPNGGVYLCVEKI